MLNYKMKIIFISFFSTGYAMLKTKITMHFQIQKGIRYI